MSSFERATTIPTTTTCPLRAPPHPAHLVPPHPHRIHSASQRKKGESVEHLQREVSELRREIEEAGQAKVTSSAKLQTELADVRKVSGAAKEEVAALTAELRGARAELNKLSEAKKSLEAQVRPKASRGGRGGGWMPCASVGRTPNPNVASGTALTGSRTSLPTIKKSAMQPAIVAVAGLVV